MSVPVCHHLKEDGVYCNSAALNGRDYCYFHLNLRGRRLKAARARRRGDNPPLNLPFPEDMHAVQVSLAETLWALAEQRIDHRTAGLMLYTLQQAATNLNHTPRWQGERKAVENSRPLRALSDPGFEKRFDLPENTDLDTLPEPGIGRPIPPSFGGVGPSEPHQDNPIAPLAIGKAGTSAESSSSRCSPECVPIPEDEFANLKMTRAEEMEFFSYRLDFDNLKDEDEDRFKLAWLRAKRAGKLYRNEEERERGAVYEELFSETPPSDKPEAA